MGDMPYPLTLTHDIPCLTCAIPPANNETIHSLDDKTCDLVYICMGEKEWKLTHSLR